MARFVLVHGGFSGAWIWLPLMDTLKEAGHLVEALDLPGMGDDHTSASEVSLDSYAGPVCEVLAANSEPAIVVGHSMGGIVATHELDTRVPRANGQPWRRWLVVILAWVGIFAAVLLGLIFCGAAAVGLLVRHVQL